MQEQIIDLSLGSFWPFILYSALLVWICEIYQLFLMWKVTYLKFSERKLLPFYMTLFSKYENTLCYIQLSSFDPHDLEDTHKCGYNKAPIHGSWLGYCSVYEHGPPLLLHSRLIFQPLFSGLPLNIPNLPYSRFFFQRPMALIFLEPSSSPCYILI